MNGQLADPAFASLLARQVSQLTPEWELKMEYVLKDDGTFRFDAPDAIAAFARAHGMRLHGHTLVWYAQKPVAFERIDGQRRAFEGAYRSGADAEVDRAIRLNPALEAFLGQDQHEATSLDEGFGELGAILAGG